MDELRGPNIQIVLHVKNGLGFGFLKAPFVVTGSLNGYMLDTDPTVPTHAPVFDAELVWEADKRKFRNLRVQNVPIKIEVYTMGTQGRKDKIGYLLLSLLGAQPCPNNKIVDVKHNWHRLLGVKAEGKCCQPQLLLSLCIQDRISLPTPRNEMRIFHSNEAAFISNVPSNPATAKSSEHSLSDFLAASTKVISNLELRPRLLSKEGVIEIGPGRDQFVLSFVIGTAENIDLLVPNYNQQYKHMKDCFINYSIFTQNITTDRVPLLSNGGVGASAHFNQRTSLRLRSDLSALTLYFAECPLLVARLCTGEDKHIGICSIDLRKIIPTDNIKEFLSSFCNDAKSLTVHERCFMLNCEERAGRQERNTFLDMEISLRYVDPVDIKNATARQNVLMARSVTQMQSECHTDEIDLPLSIDFKSGSCTQIERDVCDLAYTNISDGKTNRYKNTSATAPTSEIAALIKQMCESLTLNQERLWSEQAKFTKELLSERAKMQIIETPPEKERKADTLEQAKNNDISIDQAKKSDITLYQAKSRDASLERANNDVVSHEQMKGDKNIRSSVSDAEVQCDFQAAGDSVIAKDKTEPDKTQTCSCSTIVMNEKDKMKQAFTAEERDAILQKYVDELEDWKEKQQDLYKIQLDRKEQYHLEQLAKEWARRRVELECKLSKGIEQCRSLAAELARATEDFRLRGYRNCERERKLVEAKKALEQLYTAKYQALREASLKMEEDVQHQLRLKDLTIKELETSVDQAQREMERLRNKMSSREKEVESKYSGLNKDQTASLLQELRALEEKLESAVQSKAFFKEQWGRAVRELHYNKLSTRRQVLTQLKSDKKQLKDLGLDPHLEEIEEPETSEDHFQKLKDDYYVESIASTPALDSCLNMRADADCMEIYKELNEMNSTKQRQNDKLSELINRRERLVVEDNPDEELLNQLNKEIRNMLLSCSN